jgi:alginate O-acetyltransferase complex protein AlgI
VTFASFSFVLVFLPLAFAGYALAYRNGGKAWAINYLAALSFTFYALWGLPLLVILAGSVLFNYGVGQKISSLNHVPAQSRRLFQTGLAANLVLLGYLKYTNFFIDIANQVAGTGISHLDLLVPIGVSFFTFVQIGYLIDAYNGQLLPHNFSRYVVFSAFFPCVTAGPLVLQREMMGQMEESSFDVLNARRIIIGLTMFGLGLFKKVVLADSIAPSANFMFDGAALGLAVTAVEAWVGSVSYALQLYFDFSGYSDMAIGLGTIFGLKLPLNFASPFKATNISDFWRRWHMTMTRFFTTYVFSGLALNGMRKSAALGLGPKGKFLRVAALPMILTFLVAGIWHGSGWTFVLYGLMHGIAIATCLAWREFSGIKLPPVVGWALTMATVASGLVLFRSPDVATAANILQSMWGFGAAAGAEYLKGFDIAHANALITLLAAIVLLMPNSQQVLHTDWPTTDAKPEGTSFDAGLLAWRPSFGPAVATATLYTFAMTSLSAGSSFLYYKF